MHSIACQNKNFSLRKFDNRQLAKTKFFLGKPSRPGEYNTQVQRNNFPYTFSQHTVVAGPGVNQITIQQVQTNMAGPLDIQVIVNCDNYTLTVVEKAVDGLAGYTVRGSGTFTDNTLFVDFALWSGSTKAESYQLTITRK